MCGCSAAEDRDYTVHGTLTVGSTCRVWRGEGVCPEGLLPRNELGEDSRRSKNTEGV